MNKFYQIAIIRLKICLGSSREGFRVSAVYRRVGLTAQMHLIPCAYLMCISYVTDSTRDQKKSGYVLTGTW